MKALVIIGALALSACVTTSISNDVPQCGRLVPDQMKARTVPTDLPEPRSHRDGHQDAEPWMVGFVGQTGQLDKANDRGDAIEHIYRTCLELHTEALRKSRRGFFGRLFGG